eukprot:5969281-Pleurochrysis_carterae.AAC.1
MRGSARRSTSALLCVRVVRMHSVERCAALPAPRRRHFCACALRACSASSGAWLCPPLDVDTFVHAPCAHAQRRA